MDCLEVKIKSVNFLNEATFSWFFERHECFQSRIRNSEFLRRNKVQRVSQGVKYSFNHNSVCRKHTVNQTSPWQKQQQRKHFLSFCIPPNFCNGFPGGSADTADEETSVNAFVLSSVIVVVISLAAVAAKKFVKVK